MQCNVVARVFCVDGPFHGVQYIDLGTGRILFKDDSSDLGLSYFYKVSNHEATPTDFGLSRVAYLGHAALV